GTVRAVAAVGGGQRTADHHRTWWYPPVADLARHAVVDLRALADVHPHRDHGVLADDDAFDDFGARTDEAVVLDDGRIGLQRLENAPDADAAGQVDVPADLGAGADRRPGIDHRPFIDIGTDIDVGRHEDHVAADERAPAGNGRRHDPESGLREALGRIGIEFRGHLVEEAQWRLAHRGVVLEAEGQQHRLLDPLVDDPVAADPARHAQAAGVEFVDDMVDRVADIGGGAGWPQRGALFPGAFDRLLHDGQVPEANCTIRPAASRQLAGVSTRAMRTKPAPGFSPCQSRASRLPGRTRTLYWRSRPSPNATSSPPGTRAQR